MITYNISSRSGLHVKLSRIFSYRNYSQRKVIRKYPQLRPGEALKHPRYDLDIDDELYNTLKGKVIYNCAVKRRNSEVRWHVRRQIFEYHRKKSEPSVPISLKYAYGDSVYEFDEFRDTNQVEDNEEAENDDDDVNLPYSIVQTVEFQSDSGGQSSSEVQSDRESQEDEMVVSNLRRRKFNKQSDVDPSEHIGRKWMSDYEVYEEIGSDEVEEISIPQEEYGTADPNVLPTNIPCSGCGAHLHCQSSSVPGFIPKEIFFKCTKEDFYRVICQRCTLLKHYNVALSVSVDPDAYPKLLCSLKNQDCLLIIMVDMTDFPCSIWPNILDIVGYDKPLILVGNKIDLIPGDCPGWLQHAEKVLRKSFPAEANVLCTRLISAKTGFGVESLITALQSKWKRNSDVYLVGCTNVGKSSLFNDLIGSDYCKSKAADLMQRATVSPWPGTTLNLLKFPILRMDGWRAYLRTRRVQRDRDFLVNERKMAMLQDLENHKTISKMPDMTGLIGRTFPYVDPKKEEGAKNAEFVLPKLTNQFIKSDERPFMNPNDKEFAHSKWCYDTPGVVHRDQLINLLTTEELQTLMTNNTYRAKIFSVYVGQTVFIAGLARIDHVETDNKYMRFIVYAPRTLPITVCWTEAAEEVYDTLLGTKHMMVPRGSAKRLEKWPLLKNGDDVEIIGQGTQQNSSEIVLSSAGWVSFVGKVGMKSKMRPWTPEGRGIYLRKTPLLKFTHRQKGTRISGTPTYTMRPL